MSRFSRWLLRAPRYLYRWRLGWLLGRRFVLIKHRGRKSGLIRETVLEVVDVIDGFPVIAAGFGAKSDWVLNISKDPSVFVFWSRHRFVAMARRLDVDEATEVFERYRVDHRVAAKALGGVVGVSLVDDIEEAAEKLPVFHLRRAARDGTGAGD